MKRLRCAPACEGGAAHVRRACQSCLSRGTFRAGFEKVLEKYEFSRVKVGRIAYVELSFRDNANASHCVSSHPPCYAVRFTSGTAYRFRGRKKIKEKKDHVLRVRSQRRRTELNLKLYPRRILHARLLKKCHLASFRNGYFFCGFAA